MLLWMSKLVEALIRSVDGWKTKENNRPIKKDLIVNDFSLDMFHDDCCLEGLSEHITYVSYKIYCRSTLHYCI